jgi:hypothetical protein
MRKSKNNGLTEIERQFAEKWLSVTGLDMTVEKHWPFLRYTRRITAYHEAGHVASRMFTGHEDAHITMVSVIPDDDTIGRVILERCCDANNLKEYPPVLRQLTGRKMLLGHLSGRGAEMRVSTPDDQLEILDDDNWCEEIEPEDSDCIKAKRVSEVMAKPRMPAYRIIKLAEKWTNEMMDIPDVWQAVERCASLLYKRGYIDDKEEIGNLFEKIRWTSFRLPKWRRRLCLNNRSIHDMACN